MVSDTIEVTDYLRELSAPEKRKVVLRTSGHRSLFEQPGELIAAIDEVVLGDPG